MSKWMAKKTTGTELIDPNAPRNQAEAWLLQEIAQLSQRAGINMPEVGIFLLTSPMLLQQVGTKNDALVAVSTGLLERMNKDELRAVLAHEIGIAGWPIYGDSCPDSGCLQCLCDVLCTCRR